MHKKGSDETHHTKMFYFNKYTVLQMLFCHKSKFALWVFLSRRLCCIIFLKQVNNSVNLKVMKRILRSYFFKELVIKL